MTTIKRTKDRQYNDIVVIVLSVLRPFNCGHCIVCPSSFLLWSLYCLSFVLFIVGIALSVLRPFYCIKRTKDKQYNDHNKKDEGQTMQWPQKKGRRTDNTMTTIKRTKDRQYHDHVCPSSFLLWSWYCLSFVLFIVVMVLYVLRPFYCGHCLVCPSSFLLTANAMTTIKRTKNRQYNDHNKKDEGQTMQWPQ
jgi:Flp pilus assembly protein TadB